MSFTTEPPQKRAHVIVFGNEKGGSGKSTAAMHAAVGLMRLGYTVGTIDLDSHQATMTSYMKNRWRHVVETGEALPCPDHIHIDRAEGSDDLMGLRDEERKRVDYAIADFSSKKDFIVIDTPGSDRYMSIMGHFYADTLVTPMNDSFVDLDLLAKVDHKTHKMIKPSIYTELVWDLRSQRLKKDKGMIDWVVMRNRLSHIDQKNKKQIGEVLDQIAPVLGFRLAPGFGERVIFREMFLDGLTLLDLKSGLTLSNVTARQEVRHLIKTILPEKTVSTLSLLHTA